MAKADLLGILYLSETHLQFDATQLYQLTKLASQKNSRLGITGFLYLEGQHFLQYLEGEPKQVKDLVDIIAADKRHKVTYVYPIPINERKFPSWDMEYVDPSQAKAIRLENLLMDTLSLMKNPQVINAEYKERMILRMLNRLSVSREQLSFS